MLRFYMILLLQVAYGCGASQRPNPILRTTALCCRFVYRPTECAVGLGKPTAARRMFRNQQYDNGKYSQIGEQSRKNFKIQ